jgi:hypothetical protein
MLWPAAGDRYDAFQLGRSLSVEPGELGDWKVKPPGLIAMTDWHSDHG